MQTYTPRRTGRLRAILRGLTAVAGLLLSALDALITARIGVPRLTWIGRQVGRELASEYRRGRAGAVDADVIDEEDL